MTTSTESTSPRDDGNTNDKTAAFDQVLTRELALIDERRRIVLGRTPPNDLTPPAAPVPDVPEGPKVPEEFARAQRRSTFGLSFSGGGIRSATFNLGVLQALAEKDLDLVKHVDYLSTVSGGGYIGSWLHGVMYRGYTADSKETETLDDEQRKKIAAAQFGRAVRTLKSGIKQEPGSPDEDPITFLRKYSNYLAPRPGLFSADTWTIGFIWLRNVLLNQLILVPAIAALVALTLIVLLVVQWQPFSHSDRLGINVVASALALLSLVGAIGFMVRELNGITQRSFDRKATDKQEQPDRMRWTNGTKVVALVSMTLLLLGVSHFELYSWTPLIVSIILIALMMCIQYFGGYVDCYKRSHGSRFAAIRDVLWMSTICGALAGVLVTVAWDVMAGNAWPAYFRLAFGPPLIGVGFVASVMLLVGLMGADYPDAAREWTARTGSTLAIVTAGWLAWFALAVFGPWLVTKLVDASTLTAITGAAAWIATTVGGVLAGKSSRTAEGKSSITAKPLKLLIAIAPTVFLVGYIIAIASAVHAFVPPSFTRPAPAQDQRPSGRQTVSLTPQDNSVQLVVEAPRSGTVERALQPVADFGRRYPGLLLLSRARPGFSLPSIDTTRWTQLDWLAVTLLVTFVVALIASRRINVNEFSLHHFYKNRLVRCYLGASNTERRHPNLATGFDPSDDMPIAKLRSTAPKEPYYGPYPIINAALNLNAGSELATQERKATSFVFSPEYCGFSTKRVGDDDGKKEDRVFRNDVFEVNGYRPTRNYSYADGPNVGTAVAISGAAANPNWGYHTSGPMAFLLTVFNARLGWWLGNPRWQGASRSPGPKFALRYLFSELLGQTTGRSQYVNLSDGGHFDNLGLYELVQRRCRFIVVCDAEEDHDLTFGSLGGAIRKCRADFGVEIDIDTAPIHQSPRDGFSKAHCVVGTILYPEKETAFSAGPTAGVGPAGNSYSLGWLVYLKSSLTGDEPADVLEYRSQFPEFPHQSTGDQFFSESQFESYRRLGYHVCRSAFAGVTLDDAMAAALASAEKKGKADETRVLLDTYPMVALFQEMTRKWYAPIPVSPEAATRLANAYVELMQRIAKSDDLKELNQELTSGKPFEGRTAKVASPAELAAGMDLMQLVQNVYTEFNFETAFNRANPRNSGWMSVFRKWRKSPILSKQIWPKIRDDYHSLFQTFVDKRLDEEGSFAERP